MNDIRFENALKQSRFKHHRHTFRFFLDQIPADLLDSLTAQQIARIIDALYGVYRQGVSDGRAMED